jgi:hypothetical protein
MSQTQAIFAQAVAPKFSVGETIGSAVSQTVDWLGRTITYLATTIADYAVKAWEYSLVFFAMALDFVNQNQQTFSYVGAAATLGGIAYLIAKMFGSGAKQEVVHKPQQPEQA